MSHTPSADSHPLDETGQVVYPDFDNRPSTNLYTLEDVQEYEAEVARAAVEGRDPVLTDPRKRVHPSEILNEQLVLEPLVDTGSGGVALAPGVTNTDQGVVSDGTNALPVGYTGPVDVTVEEQLPAPALDPNEVPDNPEQSE